MKKILVGVVAAVMSASVFAASDAATQKRIDDLEKRVRVLEEAFLNEHKYQNLDMIGAMSNIIANEEFKNAKMTEENIKKHALSMAVMMYCGEKLTEVEIYPFARFMKECVPSFKIRAAREVGQPK